MTVLGTQGVLALDLPGRFLASAPGSAPVSVRRVGRPRLLDLFCKEGGAGMGYHLAGFEVIGVDIEAQHRYPFEFHQADALEFLETHADEFDAFHASPPCQAYTQARSLQARTHPELVTPVREAFTRLAGTRPWLIENVPGAPLSYPVVLCGAMFPGLRVYRHRLFESNTALPELLHPRHQAKVTPLGKPPVSGEFMTVVGNFSGVEQARTAMGAPWMSRDGLREAIPPAYTHHLGTHLLAQLHHDQAAA